MPILWARLWVVLKVAKTKAWAVVEEADAELNLTKIGHLLVLVHTSLENLEIDIWFIKQITLDLTKHFFTHIHLFTSLINCA